MTQTPSLAPSSFPSTAPTQSCNLDEEERSRLIRIFLNAVSGSEVDAPGTPQYLAAEWIVNQDPSRLCPQDPRLIQRYTVALFYYATDGGGWAQCSAPANFTDPVAIAYANANCNVSIALLDVAPANAWLTPSSECSWGGLACDANEKLERIEFERNNVGGRLPSELDRLKQLRFLILEEGSLSGTIPSSIGNIQTLEVIDLNYNVLSGSLPENLFRLTNLQQLDINDNELTGTISSSIERMMPLRLIQIENNKMTGTIPSTMGNLKLLEIATMNNNQLSGAMPNTVCQLPVLAVLTTDCLGAPGRSSPPYVECPCCTQCF